jgi:hypothetical protein
VPTCGKGGHRADREDLQDRAAAVGGEHRRERADHRELAPEVHLHLEPRAVERGREERGHRRGAAVVDEQREVGAARGGGRHLGGVGDVELERHDACRVQRRTARSRVERVARRGIDAPRAALQQRGDESGADAAVGAGDECDTEPWIFMFGLLRVTGL